MAKPMPIPFEKVSAVMDKETYDWPGAKGYAGDVAQRGTRWKRSWSAWTSRRPT